MEVDDACSRSLQEPLLSEASPSTLCPELNDPKDLSSPDSLTRCQGLTFNALDSQPNWDLGGFLGLSHSFIFFLIFLGFLKAEKLWPGKLKTLGTTHVATAIRCRGWELWFWMVDGEIF